MSNPLNEHLPPEPPDWRGARVGLLLILLPWFVLIGWFVWGGEGARVEIWSSTSFQFIAVCSGDCNHRVESGQNGMR